MKKTNSVSGGSIFWGLVLIAVAVFLVLDIFGISFSPLKEVGFVRLALGIALLAWLVQSLLHRNFNIVFLQLALLLIVFKEPLSGWLAIPKLADTSGWLIVLCGLLLTGGFSLIFGDGGICEIEKKDTEGNVETKRFGSSNIFIDCTTFSGDRTVRNELGSCTIQFNNPDAYEGGSSLTVRNELGSVSVLVPATWHVIVNAHNELGSVNIPDEGNAGGKVLNLTVHNELGSVNVKYI